jgi:chemotaxis signal transduction protein
MQANGDFDDESVSAAATTAASAGVHVEMRIAVRLAETLPWLVLPAGMSCQYVERPTMSAIPNVTPWFVGAFAERGVITPIFDLSRWLDPSAAATARGLVVVRNGPELIGFISIDAPKILRVRPALADIHSLDDEIRPYTGATYLSDADACIEFLPFDWVHANAARISITE